ncbi:hypothetical protein F2Q69_00021623 [Brassica cretica]|uniref:Uncharacterized protein n=1 Tax=Brassica cretica TaxID=69181 RepID=A0A8S9Q7U7_BRACR|nr:hypothetical protein F2Q69_00021623 [Brassica cretica]
MTWWLQPLRLSSLGFQQKEFERDLVASIIKIQILVSKSLHLVIDTRKVKPALLFILRNEVGRGECQTGFAKLLARKQACLVEDAEAVDREGRAEGEEDVNFIGGTGFQRSGNQNGNFYGQRNDDFWQVVKQEKLQEGDFEVESSMSFGGSHWCRSTLDFEHRSTDFSQNRSTGSPEHRWRTPTESTAFCYAVRIMTHEEFAARHPHPPSPMQKIDVARLNALTPQPKPSANHPETTITHSDDAAEPMEVDKAPMGRTWRKSC